MAEADKSSKPGRAGNVVAPTARHAHLSEEERKRLWRKAVMEKAGQIKKITDFLILVLLGLVLVAHVLPFVRGGRKLKTYDGYGKPQYDVIEQKRGYAIMLDLLVPYDGTDQDFEETDPFRKLRLREPPKLVLGVQPRILHGRDHRDGRPLSWLSGEPMRWFRNVYPAPLFAYLILLVPIGAVVVLVLYALDYKLWMGRALPAISCVYGFASVAYLMITRVPTLGAWNALRWGSALAWYLLLIPLFLIGAVSLLRYFVSDRWKRYVWAGLEIPEHLRPPEPEKGEAGGEGGDATRRRRRGAVGSAKLSARPGAAKKAGAAGKTKAAEKESGDVKDSEKAAEPKKDEGAEKDDGAKKDEPDKKT